LFKTNFKNSLTIGCKEKYLENTRVIFIEVLQKYLDATKASFFSFKSTHHSRVRVFWCDKVLRVEGFIEGLGACSS
jgi:hypothetical protein